jgi:hypothetical protein
MDEKQRIMNVQAQRARFITTIAFFIAGLSIVFSLDLSRPFSSPGLRSGGLFILLGGVALAIVAYVLLQRGLPSSRPCANCRQEVPLGASSCPSCGQQVRGIRIR